MSGPRGAAAFVAIGLALTLSVVALVFTAPGARAGSVDFTVSLSATPSRGPPPLSVDFRATVSSGSPTLYSWSFGDGSRYDGTNASAADPNHVYSQPGFYNASVVVTESTGSNSSTIEVDVVAPAFSAVITASAVAGPAPLTETFSAQISGGTGTYVNLSWSFGDGDSGEGNPVQYTYVDPGTYHVRFTVYDSANASTNASAWVNVTADANSTSTGPPPWQDAIPWAVLGAAIGAIVVLAVARYRLRTGPAPGTPSGTGQNERPTPSVPRTDAGLAGGSGATPMAVPSTSTSDPPPEVGRPRVSQRVILHLAQQGWLGEDEVASVPFTQGGMSEALGIPQTSLTNVLRRLMAAGVLTQDVRHVRGRDRRLKVYRLTPRGQALARDLLHPPR